MTAAFRAHRRALVSVLSLALATPVAAEAQGPDSAFVAMQALGTHRFDDLADGGRIVLQRDPTDTSGVRVVREHLSAIARAFAQGDFGTPAQAHSRKVPGTDVMAARRKAISYQFRPLPGGSEVRMTTRNRRALEAIHAFLAFQRREHHESGGGTAVRRYGGTAVAEHSPSASFERFFASLRMTA